MNKPHRQDLCSRCKQLGRRCTEDDYDDLVDVMDGLNLNQYDSDQYDSDEYDHTSDEYDQSSEEYYQTDSDEYQSDEDEYVQYDSYYGSSSIFY